MSDIWNAIKDFLASGIELLHGVFEPIFGTDAAWGWAIIGLTVVVRILLIPLAVKQFRSMRAMQVLQPQIKAIQKKYKMDRSVMRSDPERYRKIQGKKNEELQALYKEHEVNPAAGCLPLLAQGPVFFALYSVLRDQDTLGGAIATAHFYVFDTLGEVASAAGVAGIGLILLVAASMFISQKQMMARNTGAQDGAQATQQKVMLYAMPAMMGFFGFQLPVGVLLYWVTTNIWTMAQQSIIMREATEDADGSGPAGGPTSNGSGGPAKGAAGNTRRAVDADDDGGQPRRGFFDFLRPDSDGPGPGDDDTDADDEAGDDDAPGPEVDAGPGPEVGRDGGSSPTVRPPSRNGDRGRRTSHLPTRPSRRN